MTKLSSIRDTTLGALCVGVIAPRHLFSGERTRPRVLSLAPRQRLCLVEQEKHFGEAPKWAREARALPKLRAKISAPRLPAPRFDAVIAHDGRNSGRAWLSDAGRMGAARGDM